MLQQQKSKLQCPQNKEQIAVDLLASTECPRHSSDKPLLCILIREAQKRHRKTWGARFEDRIAEDCFYTRSLGKHSLLDLPRQAFQRALRAFEATLLEIGVGRLSESRCWRRFCLMRAAEQSMTGVYKRWGSLESVLVAIVDAMKYWRHLETSGDIWRHLETTTGQEFQANSAWTWQKAFTIWRRRRPSKICQGKLRQADTFKVCCVPCIVEQSQFVNSLISLVS